MFIKTVEESKLPTDTFENGELVAVASFINFKVEDKIYFVEDDADLTEINYTPVDSTEKLKFKVDEYCKKYLASTDWVVVKSIETGNEIPPTIKNLRTKIRNIIS